MMLLIIAIITALICAIFADNHYREDRWGGLFVWGVFAFAWAGTAIILFRAEVLS